MGISLGKYSSVLLLMFLVAICSVGYVHYNTTNRVIVITETSDKLDALVDLVKGKYGVNLRHRMAGVNIASFEVKNGNLKKFLRDKEIPRLASYVGKSKRIYIPELCPDKIIYDKGQIGNFIPNDPFYQEQWGLPCIDASRAWNRRIGDKEIIVAIIDTGVELNHPDLRENVERFLGWDFVNDDDLPTDDHGHGTHCAGILAAGINDTIGVAGAFQVRIMPIKCFNEGGYGEEDDIAMGIVHAIENGADVISMSWGSWEESVSIEMTLRAAYLEGIILVAAAGNGGFPNPFYPAHSVYVIGVGALRKCDERAPLSNKGFGDDTQEGNVEIMAPGEEILSSWLDSSWCYLNGTSMATPFVAAVAAGYKSWWPDSSNVVIRKHMQANADSIPGTLDEVGYGRVDAWPPID